jgi:hypothetical protein
MTSTSEETHVRIKTDVTVGEKKMERRKEKKNEINSAV